MLSATFCLGIATIAFNSITIAYYKNTRKNLVPFIYMTLSISDVGTGLAALLHSMVFLLIITNILAASAYAAFTIHFITVVTFRVSCFVSMLICIIRSINIARPFTIINRRVVMASIGCCILFWVAVVAAEAGLIMGRISGHDYEMESEQLHPFLYKASEPSLIITLLERSTNSTESITREEQCVITTSYIFVTIFLPTILSFITMIHQAYQLRQPTIFQNRNDASEKRKITVTIIMLTLLFVLTSSLTLMEPILATCSSINIAHPNIFSYTLGHIPMFINAVLNPLILIVRGRQLPSCISRTER